MSRTKKPRTFENLRLAITWEPFWNVDNGQTLCKDCHHKKGKHICPKK